MNVIVTRIEELRRKYGISKKGLADKMGIPISTVWNWYYSDVVPSLPNIENVCRAFDITVEQFFSGMNKDESGSEVRFIDGWRMLSPAQKQAVKSVMEAFGELREGGEND